MIIEINGLPGSGKTYLFQRLACNLDESGFKVVNVSQLESSFMGKLFQKLISIYLLKREISKNITIREIAEKCKKRNAIYASTIKANSYIKRYLYLRWIYRRSRNRKKIYLFDEGIYQVLTALSVDFGLCLNDVQCLMQYYGDNDLPNVSILYNASIQKSLDSITIRNRQICDIDKLNGDKLKQMLKEYKEMFGFLMNHPNEMLVLERNDSIEYNVSKISRKIKGLI